MTDSSVVLPQPDGPTISVIWPAYTSQSMPAQRLDSLLAAAEVLGQPADPYRDRPAAVVFLDGRLARSATLRQRSDCHDHHSIPCQNGKTANDPVGQHSHPQRKTIAGSSRITRWTLSRLDSTQIRTIAPAVIGSSCQGVKNASSVPWTRQPNRAARPTPIP